MILDQLIFGTALIGSGIAAAYDLKTTEVPNWVFYAILITGVPLVALNAYLNSSFDMFALSGVTGLGLFILGYAMYRAGQWGGADMVLLALIGFLMPSTNLGFAVHLKFPFGLSFLINLFLVGGVYMMVYSFVFALQNRRIIYQFKEEIKDSARLIFLLCASSFLTFTGLAWYLGGLFGVSMSLVYGVLWVSVPTALIFVLYIVYIFARTVEKVGFRKKIPVSQLKVGDMLMEERKLVGVEERQIKMIRKSGRKYIWIKEGVRFAPAFPLALLFTLFVGDAIFLLPTLLWV
jgi:Flp pilus assembly protein protease CpaA